MRCHCYACNNDFETDVLTVCPFCGAVGDDLDGVTAEEINEEWEPTEEELEAMYEDYEMRRQIGNAYAVIGAQ